MTPGKKIRTFRIGAQLIAAHLAIAVPCIALAQSTHTFGIPAQSLADSLRAVATQAGVNVVFEPSSVQDKQAPVLNGSYPVPEALGRLLNGSGLSLRTTQGGSFVIDMPGAGAGNSAGDGMRALRIAQADRPSPSEGEGKGEDRKDEDKESSSSEEAEDRKGIPEVLVKGNRSMGAHIDLTSG